MINLFKPYMNVDFAAEKIRKILASNYVGEGNECLELENLWNKHYNTDNCVLVNSGTSAIHLALDMIREEKDLPTDTEILSVVLGCYASTSAILNNGYKIRWVDIDNTLNISLDDLERKLTSKTRIVFLVHWGGYPVDLNRLESIKAKYFNIYGNKLEIIEDCAHVLNSTIDGKLIGNCYNNWKVFSFQSIKHFSTVDGGLLITPTLEQSKKARLKRWFGLDRAAGASMRCLQNVYIKNTYKFQPNNVLASIGLANYAGAIQNVEKHRENATYYNKELKNIHGLSLPNYHNGSNSFRKSCYWLYPIMVSQRTNFERAMNSRGIECNQTHLRMDTHDTVKEFRSILPNIDQFQDLYTCIPVGFWLTEKDREAVVNAIKAGW